MKNYSGTFPWSPLRKAVSIRLDRPKNNNENELVILAELRCGSAVIEDNRGWSYAFGFSTLHVELEAEDCELKIGKRLGDRTEHIKVVSKKSDLTTKAHSTREKYRGMLGPDVTAITTGVKNELRAGFKGSLNLEKTREKADQIVERVERDYEEIYYPVISNGADELIVSSISEGKFLQGQYLGQDDLCTIVVQKDKFYSVSAKVFFQPKYVVFEEASNSNKYFNFRNLSKNKIAFVKLLISKHLAAIHDEQDVKNLLSRIVISVDKYSGPEISDEKIQ